MYLLIPFNQHSRYSILREGGEDVYINMMLVLLFDISAFGTLQVSETELGYHRFMRNRGFERTPFYCTVC